MSEDVIARSPDTLQPGTLPLQAQLDYRRWVRGTILLLACVSLFFYIATRLDPAALSERRPWLLLPLIFVYFSLAMTFLPLPTMPLIVLAAGPEVGLNPWLVALICTIGTGVANLHDYYIISFLYRYKRVQRIRQTQLYAGAARWFDQAPFITLTAASFVPIPVDVVRLLAISQHYPRGKFALASVIGRFPRYLIMAILADRFKMGWLWVFGVLAATVILGLGRVVYPRLKRLFNRRRKEA